MKKIKYTKSFVLSLCITSSFMLGTKAFALTTKEVWLEFSGLNNCQQSFCADGIPAPLLKTTLSYFRNIRKIISNSKFVTIIDFTKLSTEKRMFILNLKTGSVEKLLVTHGKKSDAGMAQAKYFSNTPDSEMSSIGFYLTDSDSYEGIHGTSLRLDGLSETNSNARLRNIVIHGADYATQWFVDERGRLGLSQGCPAIDPERIVSVIKKIKGESLLYIYSDQPSL